MTTPVEQDSQGNTMDNPMLALIETLAVTWFTLEYLLRLDITGMPFKFNTMTLWASLARLGSPTHNLTHISSGLLELLKSGSF